MRNLRNKSFLILLMFVALIFSVTPMGVFASSSTTYTYALDDQHHYVQTQDAYLPGQTITNLYMKNPTDIAIDEQDRLVIADSGNQRVIVYDPISAEIVLQIDNDYLSTLNPADFGLDPDLYGPEVGKKAFATFELPSGVFVVREASGYLGLGDIYVADPVATTVYHFDKDGNLLELFQKPDAVMYESSDFEPEKVAVDKAGIMYIVSKGTSDGIVQLSNTGVFLGFFSSNTVNLTLREQIQKLIYSDEQLENLGINLIPPVFTSVFIDLENHVYSSSSGIKVENLKKHNTQGANMLADIWISDSHLSDLYVDNLGIIYTADQGGWIDVYTNDGEFIYSFGTTSDLSIAGFFKTLAGIAVDASGQIWTVDSGNSYLQSFLPTEYAQTIYSAITHYNNAEYEIAIEEWQQVLSLNQLSILAHNGIAKNYLQTYEYQLAADHFKIAGNRDQYSDAFWEIRNMWLQANLIWIIAVTFVVTVSYFILKLVDRKHKIFDPLRRVVQKTENVRLINDVLYMREVFHKPSDYYYSLRKKRRGSYVGAFLILLLTFLSYLYYIAGKGFIFQTVAIQDIDLNSIVLGFVVLIGLFILCSYLVTSIQDGEGTLGEIFKGFVYSLWPFILGSVLSTLFSYIATNNELFLLNLIFYFGLAGSALFIFISIAEIQNYSFWQTVKSVLLTILFVLVILLVISFLQMTIKQLFSFVIEFFKEVVRNVIG